MYSVGEVGCCGKQEMAQVFQPVGFQQMEESVMVVDVMESLLPQAEQQCSVQLQLDLRQKEMDPEDGVMYDTFEDPETQGLEFSSVRVTWLSAEEILVVGGWETLLNWHNVASRFLDCQRES